MIGTNSIPYSGFSVKRPLYRGLGLIAATLLCLPGSNALTISKLGHTISVPFDYQRPRDGRFPLYYELGRPFNRTKPTVLFIVDGQQFNVRRNGMAKIQEELFGSYFNVVGIVGRGDANEVQRFIIRNGSVDWQVAFRVLNSRQWIEDIDAVRRALVGNRGKIMLYGRSGGGMLVHEYLAQHGSHVSRVFTHSACNRFIDAEFRLSSDRFWSELSSDEQDKLRQVLSRRANERVLIAQVFQRQNFFCASRRAQSSPRRTH